MLPTEQLGSKHLPGWEREWDVGPDGEKDDSAAELNQHHRSQLRDINKHMFLVHTYINHIRDVVDVIFCHHCIRCCQVQQIVIPGFCAFQLILWVLGLPLRRRKETRVDKEKKLKKIHQCRKFRRQRSLSVRSISWSPLPVEQVETDGKV